MTTLRSDPPTDLADLNASVAKINACRCTMQKSPWLADYQWHVLVASGIAAHLLHCHDLGIHDDLDPAWEHLRFHLNEASR